MSFMLVDAHNVAAKAERKCGCLAPFAEALKRNHPQITLEVLASTERLNLSRGEADIALRRYPSDDLDLITVGEVVIPIGAYVSRDYARMASNRATIQLFREEPAVAYAAAFVPDI
ncbi:LysR substrate-binding domain-containing protein [Bradyrhizobium sp. CCGUVB23]|uniref:LysR substrate-binding domain-containing protein n=1 Tax=Bradyrhizobium sp. CCGUVB23 TaxID=2949630 RepID=UPI0020B31AB6|nr:LysR substrate-binding domain-containing protein [Bradyrhizobium sp. CCGUVB23]MCP3460968.1 LysR substrate-binding domain-containing protein [Bradyrhizobium sp. CCGUVB23]